MTGGVVEDMGDVFFDFLFEGFEFGVGVNRFVGFGAKVVANFADEFFGIVEVDEGSADDVGGFD